MTGSKRARRKFWQSVFLTEIVLGVMRAILNFRKFKLISYKVN